MLDRSLQHAIAQVVSAPWEPHFHPRSYGFHPKRPAGPPGRPCHPGPYPSRLPREVEWDLPAFFGRVNADRLLARLKTPCPDAELLHLINRFLKASVGIESPTPPTPLGVPQGGLRSPVLASGVLEVLSPARDLDKGVRCKLRCDLWKRWGRTGYREWRERGVSDRETRTPASPQTVRGGCRKHRPCKSRSPLRFFEQRGLPSLAPRQELASSNRRIRDPFFRWSVGGRGREAFSYPAWA